MVQPVPELRAIERPALTTSIPTLDRILGSFEAGKVTLIDSGSDFVYHLTTLLCVRAVMEGHEVVFLDGGNSVDPHGMVAIAKRAGIAREEVLPRVHVARAFTCHQMTTLILDMLDKKLKETQAGLAIFACLPTMYLDEDVERSEAHQLFQRSLRSVRRTVEEREVVGLVTNAGLAKLNRRRSIRRQLYEGADRVVRVLHKKGGVQIDRLIACAAGAHDLEIRKQCHLVTTQAPTAIGQHGPDGIACLANGVYPVGILLPLANGVAGGGQCGHAFRRESHESQDTNVHGRSLLQAIAGRCFRRNSRTCCTVLT